MGAGRNFPFLPRAEFFTLPEIAFPANGLQGFPAMATTPTPNDLTRQQLDDLDALLQRMLSVPIGPTAAAPTATIEPAPTLTARLDPPQPVARTPHVAPSIVMAEAPVIYETRVDTRSFARPEAVPTPGPVLFGAVEQRAASVTVEPTPTTAYEPPVDPEPNITVEPPAVTFQRAVELPAGIDESAIPLQVAIEAPLPEPIFAPRQQVPIVAWPVYGVNRILEGCLNLFGPPGELMTTAPVKWILGLTGLGLLAFAGAWTARGLGWVTW
jgi:hypothetical protein